MIRAGKLHRARKTPSTITSEMTMGDKPTETSFVGASAAPSQAPAVRPQRIPKSCSFREREAFSDDFLSVSATGCTFLDFSLSE